MCATRYQSNNCQDNQLESTEGGSKSTKHTYFFSSELFSILSKLQATPVTKNEHRERRKNKKFASCYLTVLEIIFQQTESLRSKFLLQTLNYLSLSPSQHHTRGVRNTAASRFPNIFTEMSTGYPAITVMTPRSASGRVILILEMVSHTIPPSCHRKDGRIRSRVLWSATSMRVHPLENFAN